MDQEFSKPMRRMKRIYRWIMVVIIAVCVIISFIVGALYLQAAQAARTPAEPVTFDVWGSEGIQSSINTQVMTDRFASDFKDTNHFYFVFDEFYTPCIVRIHGELPQQYQPLVDFMYTDGTEEMPESVTITGVSTPITDEIRELSMEAYNTFWSNEMVAEDTYTDTFGMYYLDTTKQAVTLADNLSSALLWCVAVLLLLIIPFFIYNFRRTKKSLNTLNTYSADALMQVDRQMMSHDTIVLEREKLFLTEDYIVSNGPDGFEVIPYTRVSKVLETKPSIFKIVQIQTKDQDIHTLIFQLPIGKRSVADFEELYCLIKSRIEECSPPIMETQESIANNDFERHESIAEDIIPVQKLPSGKRFLGVIGAVLGALIGVGLWVLIGAIGFIAGIAGFVILKFALIGYEKLAGRMDRKGAITTLIIASVMILGANTLDYIIVLMRAYFQYEASFETATYVLTHFVELMTEFEMWGNYFINLAVGCVLSIWSSYGLISSVLTYKE